MRSSPLSTILTLFKGIRFPGILAGWLIDEGLTTSGVFIIAMTFGLLSKITGSPFTSFAAFDKSPLWYLLTFINGSGCTVVGAFFTGCIAKSHRVKNGMALWIFEYLIYSYGWFYPSHLSVWYHSLKHVTGFASACLGAWIAKFIFEPKKAN